MRTVPLFLSPVPVLGYIPGVYLEFHGLREPPFELTPNPRFLFFSPKHREAFNHLLYGIRERKGFVQLTGEVGTGKTTLCRAMLKELGDRFATALVLNPAQDAEQLLQSITREFGLPTKGLDRLETLAALNQFLIDLLYQGRDAVLVIDEAQGLTEALLEEVRLLSNLETDDRKLLQIVLMGQPELRARLDAPELRQLRQRITIRFHLRALQRAELWPYIQHRLRVAGANGHPTFTLGALWRIYRYTKGVPRLVNAVCDKCLLAGYVHKQHNIDLNLAGLAVRELEGDILA
jgi:general secretion pathway protein A